MSKNDALINSLISQAINETFSPVQQQPIATGTSNELAQYLLNHSIAPTITKDIQQSQQPGKSKHHSLIGKIFDSLSTPLNVVQDVIHNDVGAAKKLATQIGTGNESIGSFANFGKDVIGGGAKATLGGAERGLGEGLGIASDLAGLSLLPAIGNKTDSLSNTLVNQSLKLAPRRTTSDTLGDLGINNPVAKYGGGFVGDVLTDPLTYVPGVDILSVGKKAKAAEAAAKGLRTGEQIAADKAAEEASKTAQQQLVEKAARSNPDNFVQSPKPPVQQPDLIQSILSKTIAPTDVTAPSLGVKLSEGITPDLNTLPLSKQDIAETLKFRSSEKAKDAANARWGNKAPVAPIDAALQKADLVDKLRAGRIAKAGKVMDNKGNISSLGIAQTIKGISDGTINRFPQEVIPATGEAAIAADQVASKIAKNLKPTTTAGRTVKQLNPAQQVALYKSIQNAAPKGADVVSMLRSAEDNLISQGIPPVHWSGNRVRLSDVLQELGKSKVDFNTLKDFANPNMAKIPNVALRNAVTNALTRRSLSTAHILEGLSQRALQAKASVLDKYNYPVALKAMKTLPEQAADAAVRQGATAAEASAISDHIKNVLTVGNSPAEAELQSKNLIVALEEGGESSQKVISDFNDAVAETIGGTRKDLMTNVSGQKYLDGLGTRLSTWYGRDAETKKFKDEAFSFSELNSTSRAKALKGFALRFTHDEQNHAFRVAFSPESIAAEPNENIRGLATAFGNYFSSMLHSTGFDNIVDPNGVMAVRSQMTMESVNKHLKAIGQDFEFVNGSRVKVNFPGAPIGLRDYSHKGVGWMQSWERAAIDKPGQDPLSLLHDIDLALQRTTAEYSVLDNMAMRYGAKSTDSWFKPDIHKISIAHERLQGYKFDPEIADTFSRMIKDMETGKWSPNSKAMRNFAHATRTWKSLVTIYRPAHHIRNVIGDAYNTWYAGVNDARVYGKSAKFLKVYRDRYAEAMRSVSDTGDFSKLNELIDTSSLNLRQAGTKDPVATDVLTDKAGHKITIDQYNAAVTKRGLLKNYSTYEDLYGQTPISDITGENPKSLVMRRLEKPFGDRAYKVATSLAENREHYMRMAHFIGHVEKHLKPGVDLEKLFNDASFAVQKWHPDGSDLTNFEQKARLIIPFYSWTRKEIPLLLQTLVTRPAKIMAYPRAQNAFANAVGIQQPSVDDPFPTDEAIPNWIRAMGIGPVGDAESSNPVAKFLGGGDSNTFWGRFVATTTGVGGQPHGYSVVNPSNPFNDVVSSTVGYGGGQDLIRNIFNMSNPAINIPTDIATDTTFSGAPISQANGGQGLAQYLTSQIPLAGDLTRLTGVGRPDRSTKVNNLNQQNWANFLTALGIKGLGPYEKSGQFEEKQQQRYGGN